MRKGSQRLAKLLLSFLAILLLIGVVARFVPGVLREGFQGKRKTVCNQKTKECFPTCESIKDHTGCKDDERCEMLNTFKALYGTKICKKITCNPGQKLSRRKCFDPNTCEIDNDCNAGLVCNRRKCLTPLPEGKCRTHEDCKPGFMCDKGTCVKSNLTKGECFIDRDCEGILGSPFCRIIIQGRPGRCSNTRM